MTADPPPRTPFLTGPQFLLREHRAKLLAGRGWQHPNPVHRYRFGPEAWARAEERAGATIPEGAREYVERAAFVALLGRAEDERTRPTAKQFTDAASDLGDLALTIENLHGDAMDGLRIRSLVAEMRAAAATFRDYGTTTEPRGPGAPRQWHVDEYVGMLSRIYWQFAERIPTVSHGPHGMGGRWLGFLRALTPDGLPDASTLDARGDSWARSWRRWRILSETVGAEPA